jgi:hypothetical protein
MMLTIHTPYSMKPATMRALALERRESTRSKDQSQEKTKNRRPQSRARQEANAGTPTTREAALTDMAERLNTTTLETEERLDTTALKTGERLTYRRFNSR